MSSMFQSHMEGRYSKSETSSPSMFIFDRDGLIKWVRDDKKPRGIEVENIMLLKYGYFSILVKNALQARRILANMTLNN